MQVRPYGQVWQLSVGPHGFFKSLVCPVPFTGVSAPDPGPVIQRLLPALAVHSWGLWQLSVLGSSGSASRKLVPSSHPLDSQLLCRSKKPLAALNYDSPYQAASGVAVLPLVLIACLILPLGTSPMQVCVRRKEAASWHDLRLQLPNKPLQQQCIRGAGQGTKSIDSKEWIQLHFIYFTFLAGQRWQWQSIFFFPPLLHVQYVPLKCITLPISFSFWEGLLQLLFQDCPLGDSHIIYAPLGKNTV